MRRNNAGGQLARALLNPVGFCTILPWTVGAHVVLETWYVQYHVAQQQQRRAKIMLALRLRAVGRSDMLCLALHKLPFWICAFVPCVVMP